MNRLLPLFASFLFLSAVNAATQNVPVFPRVSVFNLGTVGVRDCGKTNELAICTVIAQDGQEFRKFTAQLPYTNVEKGKPVSLLLVMHNRATIKYLCGGGSNGPCAIVVTDEFLPKPGN